MAPLLEIKNLTVHFRVDEGTVHATDGISFSVEKGRALGLVGESGCGKSVTALSILRLIPDPPGRIVSGEVYWKGEDLLSRPLEHMPDIRGREIAMIFQDPMTSLNPVFTIEMQLGEVLQGRFGLSRAEARVRSIEMLGAVGIADPAERILNYPHELSGGMKQRIMIAMALLCQPDLLIADEPTTALDVTVQAQILHLIREMQKKSGAAVLLITHDLGVIAETCDDVVVMYAGKLIEACGIYELFESNRHPYTRGLLNSIPRSGVPKIRTLSTIEGVVPSMLSPPRGCRFAERCSRVEPDCRKSDPPLREISPRHVVACFHPLEGAS